MGAAHLPEYLAEAVGTRFRAADRVPDQVIDLSALDHREGRPAVEPDIFAHEAQRAGRRVLVVLRDPLALQIVDRDRDPSQGRGVFQGQHLLAERARAGRR